MSESVFLSPKSIAIVGASDKQGSVGRAITSNIMNGYKGTVYPISPTRETVFDQKAYKSVLDVPDPIDLAVVITKNTIVPVVLEECGKKGIKGAIVITAGFKEVDEEGKKLEQKLKLKDADFVYLPVLLAVIANQYTNPGANPTISGIYTGHMSATPKFTNALYFIFKLI